MTTATILSAIQRNVTLTDDETAFFTSLLLPQRVRQGEMIEREGEPTRCFIFVNAGCLMTYFTDKEDVDHVIQFATTGWWTGDLHSFTKQVPSIYTTKGLADSEVWLLPKASMEQLLERVPRFERYFRIIFQNSLITQQHRIIQSYSATVDERYLQFREKYPSLEQYVPQKYIASYLGITPEFLSKVRRRLMEKS
jgi:CRP-like cAMP-binding protein